MTPELTTRNPSRFGQLDVSSATTGVDSWATTEDCYARAPAGVPGFVPGAPGSCGIIRVATGKSA